MPAARLALTASIIASSGRSSANILLISPSVSATPSRAPNLVSNSASSSSPVSSPRRSASASASPRKSSRTVSASSPSVSQKVANAGQMLVVSTPPKSTTRQVNLRGMEGQANRDAAGPTERDGGGIPQIVALLVLTGLVVWISASVVHHGSPG